MVPFLFFVIKFGMLKISWCTDTHLDFLPDDKVFAFANKLIADNPNVILMTGDVSVAKLLPMHLAMLESVVNRPIYFVLGNHDYYGGSIENVRQAMKQVSNMSQYLRYLPNTPYIKLSEDTALIGHDGWYDARVGNVSKSNLVMNDWLKISDFVFANCFDRGVPNYGRIIEVARKFAQDAVLHVANAIKQAAKNHKVIIIATHFPPFEEVHQNNARSGDEASRPWYTSIIMGETLKRAAAAYPHVRFEVFAGHTHSGFEGQISNNLFCKVGQSSYGNPSVARTMIFS